MKTLKEAFREVCDFNNLYRAHLLARRGKRGKGEVACFELALGSNLATLQKELLNKTYQPGPYRQFVIREPKKRLILSLPYRDRVVQHSLCDNVLGPLLDGKLIYDNCASRRGKGTHFGLKRLSEFMRRHYHCHGTAGWILKGDISAYFYSIKHSILKARLYKYIADPEIIHLLDLIIDSTNDPALVQSLQEMAIKHQLPVIEPGRGLPIGNMTSQWFALFYLDPFDRYVKNELKLKHYLRYMDDFVLIHPDREYLNRCLSEIKTFLAVNLDLELNPKSQLFPLKNGVDFLGFHSYLSDTGKVIRKLRRDSKARMKRKTEKFNQLYAVGTINLDTVRASLFSWLGHARHGHTYHLQKEILKRIKLQKVNN
jgi:RNA-directed DNA polymerase